MSYSRKNLVHQDNVCVQYPNISQVLVGSDSSNALLSPIIILSCFLAAKLILSAVALAKFVRFTGKVRICVCNKSYCNCAVVKICSLQLVIAQARF